MIASVQKNDNRTGQPLRAEEPEVAGATEVKRVAYVFDLKGAETWELLNTAVGIFSPPSPTTHSEAGRSESIRESASRLAGKEVDLLREWGAAHAAKLRGTDKTTADNLLKGFIQGMS